MAQGGGAGVGGRTTGGRRPLSAGGGAGRGAGSGLLGLDPPLLVLILALLLLLQIHGLMRLWGGLKDELQQR